MKICNFAYFLSYLIGENNLTFLDNYKQENLLWDRAKFWVSSTKELMQYLILFCLIFYSKNPFLSSLLMIQWFLSVFCISFGKHHVPTKVWVCSLLVAFQDDLIMLKICSKQNPFLALSDWCVLCNSSVESLDPCHALQTALQEFNFVKGRCRGFGVFEALL